MSDGGGPVMSDAARAAVRQWIEQQHEQLDRSSYFQLLGVPRDAGDALVRTAYYHLVARFHPDLYGDNLEPETRAKLVSLYSRLVEAYQVLGDGAKRAQYLRMVDKGRMRWAAEDRARPPAPDAEIVNPSARRFLKMAQTALAAGDTRQAIMNLKLALTVEPGSELLKSELARAEAMAAGRGIT